MARILQLKVPGAITFDLCHSRRKAPPRLSETHMNPRTRLAHPDLSSPADNYAISEGQHSMRASSIFLIAKPYFITPGVRAS